MNIRQVPFKALGGIYEKDDVDRAMQVITNASKVDGNFFPLPEEADFQKALADHEGASYAIVVNSCGTALDLCMMVLGIKPGDEVITTPLTFVCTATCAAACSAKVVFADIDPLTLNLDPEKVMAKITERTKAIIPVHFTGLACDINAFDQISRDTGVPVIYDVAHALGALYKEKPIGGRGKASCYSFQSNKNITTLGEGGAVTTNDAEFAEKIRQKKTFGYVYGPSLRVVTVGFNYRMTKVQCAVGITQLAKAPRIIFERQKRMEKMNQLLEDIEEIIRPTGHGPGHGSHLYVIRLDTDKVKFATSEFQKHLKEKYQIATGKHYPIVWSWEAFRELSYDSTECSIAEKICQQVFSLPIFPDTSFDDLEYIAWAIKESISTFRQR